MYRFLKSSPYLFLFITLFSTNHLMAQEEESPAFNIVCDDKQQQVVLYEEEKKDVVFYLSKNKVYDKGSMLEITNLSKSDMATQIRSFGIYEESNWVLDMTATKKNKVYCIKTQELINQLKPGTYIINTLAIPADPELAKVVKPARVAVCKLIIQ